MSNNYPNATASAAPQQGELETADEAINRELARLHEHITCLETRLAPVSRPSIQSTAKDAANPMCPVPFAETLFSRSRSIEVANVRLREILDALAI